MDIQEDKFKVETIDLDEDDLVDVKEVKDEEKKVKKEEPEIEPCFVALDPDGDSDESDEWKPERSRLDNKENESDSSGVYETRKRKRNKSTRKTTRRKTDKEDKQSARPAWKKPLLPDLYCYLCGKKYTKNYRLNMHLNEHYENRGMFSATEYPCTVKMCGKVFTTMQFLECHMRFHEVEKHYTCKVCSRSFSTTKILRLHRATHEDEKTFSCEICSKSFVHENALIIHVEEHIKELPFPKELIDIHVISTFEEKEKIRIGVDQQLLTGGILFKCSQCPKRFASNNERRNHQTKEHPKLMTCELCGKVLRGTFAHRLHMLTHTKEKPFKCKQCEEAFASPTLLMVHRRVAHGTGDKARNYRPHQCEYCGKSYVFKYSLTEHVNFKHKNIKVICHLCGHSYVTKSRLKRHFKKVHLYEDISGPKVKMRRGKPLKVPKCPECDYVAPRNRDLRQHRIKLHMNNLHCDDCNVTLENIMLYRRHMDDHKDGESKYMVECINVKMEHEEMMNMKEEEPRVKQEPEMDTFFVALEPEMDMESDEEEWKPPVKLSGEVKESSESSNDSDEDSEQEKRRRKQCRRSVGRRSRGKWEVKPGEFEGKKRPRLPPLTCYICPKVNRTAYTQLCHLTEHYENRGAISAGQYPCKILPCGKVFTTRKFLDCHKRFHEVEKLFDCKICGRSFSSNKICQIHRKSHDREKTFNCEICPASFIHANSLTIHVEEHIKDRPFPKELLDIYVMPTFDCSNVKAKPDVAQELLTGGILFKCSQCSKRFGSFNDRRNHQNRDHPKMMTCNLCGKVLRGQFAHRLHMVIHTKEKPFKCKYCDEGFRNPNLLMNHRRATHGRGDIMKQHRPHQCETCGKSYVKKFSLKEHINCHHKGLKLVCDLCGKSYGTRSRLIQHFKKLHLSEQQEPKPRTPRKPTKFRMGPKKEPKCPECGFVAAMKKELRIHRTKEHYNNLFCTDCNVTMDNILMYRSHMQDHKDGISVVAGPGRHGQIFGCLRCDKFYTDRRFLREHINMSHNSITFTCDHCDMIFQTKRAMVRHLSKTHGVIEKEPKAKKVEGLKVKKPKKTKIKFPPPSETSSQSSLQYQMEPPQSSPLALQMPHQSPHAMQSASQTLTQTNELQQHFKVEPQMQFLHYGNM